jgi:hypothetical protein
VGILQWLVVALSDGDDDHLGGLAEVEQRGADQIPDVLDEQQRAGRRIEHPQAPRQHPGIEVAARAGVDLHDPRAGLPDTFGVEQRLLVPLDHRDLTVIAQLADGAHQQAGLA